MECWSPNFGKILRSVHVRRQLYLIIEMSSVAKAEILMARLKNVRILKRPWTWKRTSETTKRKLETEIPCARKFLLSHRLFFKLYITQNENINANIKIIVFQFHARINLPPSFTITEWKVKVANDHRLDESLHRILKNFFVEAKNSLDYSAKVNR